MGEPISADFEKISKTAASRDPLIYCDAAGSRGRGE